MNENFVPETVSDVRSKIFTTLNLGDGDNFQLLHNDVNGCQSFQLFGKITGRRPNNDFKLQKIEFKIVNSNVPDGAPYYCVSDAKISRTSRDGVNVDVFVNIKPLGSKSTGIDFTYELEEEFLIRMGDILDYHVREEGVIGGNRFGNPCKNMATYFK
ncbi:hypothetical protein POV27_03060 [Aureisphaera galaxeae]|uniref:hypothetical protein n=1 Tax=Aureisphaera galaxeae TaxID=1538023 RepID=UPI0023508981|nr:hypothetical protein [Aureisphaera galaxeae]MDC8003013.1 hypothetical protein [Aureisphaera galaxeae]